MPAKDEDIQKIADETAKKVAQAADVEEDVEVTIVENPPASGLVASRTRRVQYGSESLDLVEGEPVDIPDGAEDFFVSSGWVEHRT